MPYIHFTEEQKLRANAADLVEFLRFKGELLIREGSEFRLSSNHSVTVLSLIHISEPTRP